MIPGATFTVLFALLSAAVPGGESAEARPDEGPALARLEAEQSGLFSQVAPSVVLLVRDGASGSGFVVSADGLVLTNAHVVGEADEVAVQLFDGRHGRGRVVARASGALDLALVRLPFAGLTPLPAGKPSAVHAGMFAATVGHGGGAAWTFSTGLVANPRPLGDGAPLLLAQMALRPGSSGGPLVDRMGRAVAVVTAGTRDASGVTFAIRIDAAALAFPQLAAWLAPSPGAAPEPAQPGGPGVAERATLPAADGDERVTAVAQLSSSAAMGGAEAQPARRITVWEAPRRARRTAGRAGEGLRAAPSPRAVCSRCHQP
jgi:S1-C subfamily serine protease